MHIGVLLKGYPRLSETFIAQELHALEQHGFKLTLYSLRHPTDNKRHPVHEKIQAKVCYLPEYLHQEPLRVLKALGKCIGKRQLLPTLGLLWQDWRRDKTRNRCRRFGQALVLAAELDTSIDQLYAHFLHTPSSVCRYGAKLSGLKWSASAHARDIWTSPDWELAEKLNDLQWLATCTANNVRHLKSLSKQPEKIHLIYHGVDISRFQPVAPTPSKAAGNTQASPIKLLSVGRAVAKKGYADLLEALAVLPKDLPWRFTHIGAGPLLEELQQRATKLGIAAHIQWLGAQDQNAVIAAYAHNDIMILNSQIDDDGDRDGLPNVLVEAQAMGLCIISTAISGIPELLINEENGLLVEQKDNAALSAAIEKLLRQPKLIEQYGAAGRQRVLTAFDKNKTIDRLIGLFNAAER